MYNDQHPSIAAGFLAPSGSIAQNVTTTPGTSYVVDFWLATSTFGPTGGINPNLSVNVLWGGTTIFSQIFTSSSPYAEHTFTVTGSQSPRQCARSNPLLPLG